MKKQEARTSKELLHLERESNPLETRLRVCQSNASSGDPKRKIPPTSLPESSVLGRVKAFLPMMDEANRKLFSGIEERGREEFDLEAVDGNSDKPHIEMDLALGIADLNTPEALEAAERAAAGQTHQMDLGANCSDDSSEDDSDSDDDNDTIATKNRSNAKKVNILESSNQ